MFEYGISFMSYFFDQKIMQVTIFLKLNKASPIETNLNENIKRFSFWSTL